MLRTNTCGELCKKDIGEKVTLCGWVDTIRQFGKITFLDLRDRYGKTQVILKEKTELKQEYCIQIKGKVVERKDKNKNLPTGDIEVLAEKIKIFNESPPMPFDAKNENIDEDLRLKYRFLDLRREELQEKLLLRHKLYKSIMDYMDKKGFIYLETPILGKSTPEGARDYIVPSRVNPGKFFALPQSPQIFKQLTMIANYDKYYQIARCFRDEDLRADRQPEFTQLDIEMSFIEQEDLLKEIENLFKFIFKQALNINIKTPFPKITYEQAMKRYETDSPDTRKNKEEYSFVWVVDFPMFEYNKDDKRFYATHHPFTSPEDNADFSKPEKMKSKAYDLVLNGSEIGGGSIRIHDAETQNKVFKTLGISEKEAQEKFGFLLSALSYGAPPHGGIAFGLDRIIQIMTNSDSIRDVIAFPKNKDARDLMMDAPSEVNEAQLKEANIKLDVKNN
ncbi:MAG: aspartate--tRNA ligase [Nanoarchaeota archaeon]|nr:aspartate--tRNA ligase [Nanoarchaeota archaeon]MBU1103065.1 aspartate--tRNA ligase [Nanoarchaeota archaeon]